MGKSIKSVMRSPYPTISSTVDVRHAQKKTNGTHLRSHIQTSRQRKRNGEDEWSDLPAAMGEIMRRLTRAAPVPWPLNVMRLESPAKMPMLSFSHNRAATCYRDNQNVNQDYSGMSLISYRYPISRNCLASGWHFCFCHGLDRESDWLLSVEILLLFFNHFKFICKHFSTISL